MKLTTASTRKQFGKLHVPVGLKIGANVERSTSINFLSRQESRKEEAALSATVQFI